MSLTYSPKIILDGLVLCLDPSQNKSYPSANLSVKDGLILWLDSSDDSSFSYSSGTLVSQWRDKSGLNNHANQSTAANQPTRNSSTNSRKILTFDGTNDSLSTSISLDLSVTHTIFAIASQTTGTEDAGLVSINNSLNNGLTLHNGSTYYAYYGDGGKYATSSITTSTTYIFTKVFKGTSSTTRQVYLNGTSATTTGVIANSDASGVIRLGQQSTYLNGKIAEVIIFNRELTATELKQVHTYLGQKWGISNTDRSIVDLAGNDDNGLFGNGTVANMPLYDYYNKGTLKFDGSNDYVSVGANAILRGNSISLGVFFKTINNGQSVQFIAGYGDTGVQGYWLGVVGGPIRFFVGNGSTSLQLNSGISPNNDQIYYVVGTYDGTNQRIYVDGVLMASSTSVNGSLSYTGMTDGFLIGQVQGFTGGRYLTGNIYAMQVYNKALSAAEVLQNYEAQKSKFANTIVQNGLVLNLDAGNPYSYAGAGTTWYDVSGNAINASASGTSSYINLYGGLLSFPNNNSYYNTSTVSALNLGSASFSMECWVYLDAATASDNTYRGIISLGTNSSNFVYIAKWRSGLYTGLYVQYKAGGSTITGVYQANEYNPVSKWTHVIATKSGSSLTLYVNGSIVYTINDLNTTFTGNSSVYVAQAHSDVASLYGYVGEARVYNISLSAAQVLQNYNATKGRFGL
jgi:hypothetical protein